MLDAAGGLRRARWPRWAAASAAAALVYVLAWRRGLAGYRLVLVGVGIAAAAIAGIQYLMTMATIREASQATLWLTGSLNGRGWNHVRPVAVGSVPCSCRSRWPPVAGCACWRWATTSPAGSACRSSAPGWS